MDAIRITQVLESEELHLSLPELKPLVGKVVEIVVREPQGSDEELSPAATGNEAWPAHETQEPAHDPFKIIPTPPTIIEPKIQLSVEELRRLLDEVGEGYDENAYKEMRRKSML